jgi:hypothetical protein
MIKDVVSAELRCRDIKEAKTFLEDFGLIPSLEEPDREARAVRRRAAVNPILPVPRSRSSNARRRVWSANSPRRA